MAHGGPFSANGRGNMIMDADSTIRSIQLRTEGADRGGGGEASGVSRTHHASRGLPAPPTTLMGEVQEGVDLPVYDGAVYAASGTYNLKRTLPAGSTIIMHPPFFNASGAKFPGVALGGASAETLMARCGRKADGIAVVRQDGAGWLVQE